MEANTLLYTEEQEEKIHKLREEAEKEREARKEAQKRLSQIKNQPFSRELKEGSPVFVKFSGKSIAGTIIRVRKVKKTIQYTRTTTKKIEIFLFDVSTPLGEITVEKSRLNISGRYVEDLSGVIIPEELKKISTRKLLNFLKVARLSGYYLNFTREQIKAELANRPHISTKKEEIKFKKAFKK